MVKRIILLFALCFSLVTLIACGNKLPALPPLDLTLHAQDIKFDQNILTAKVNQPINLTYINEGMIDHAFKIEGIVEEYKVKPGETHVFTFTPKTTGEFKYVCAMPGHAEAGMVGTLKVTS